MADFKLRVSADTQSAEKDLQRIDRTANEATKNRKLRIDVPSLGEINKNFTGLSKEITNAANNIKTFYTVSKNLPGIGDQIKRYESAVVGTAKLANTAAHNTKAGDILSNSFGKANSVVGELVNKLAKLGFALFGIKEIVGVLQQAFGGFFQQTVGREIKLRETILKTQTTLASTSKVFKNGREITDPYEKIVSLTGAVRQNIDSIRQRSIELAGVTSNDVIEVFGIVASQISQIGGGLKDAEDLAINFAAALGTFGIPLYQARQEIGSILRGDITMDSYLAKALGITNEDVAKAKSQAGGLIKFLDDRLAGAVAGQKIAAQGFSGVLSNIVDLWELVGQRFGAQLLDPLVNALAAVFNSLFNIREQIFSLVDAAGSLLARFATIGREVRSRAGLVSLGEIGLPDQSGQKGLNDVKDAAQEAFVMIEGAAQRTIGAVVQIITTLKPAVMTLVDAFVRLGKSFLEVRVSVFETLARALANVISFWSLLIQGVANLFNIYTRLLDLPVLQYFAELTATMNLLKRAGMDFVINAILIGNTLIRVVVPALGAVGTTIGVLIAGVGAVVLAIGKFALVVGALAASLATLPTVTSGVAKALSDVSKNLSETGNQAVKTGVNLEVVSGGFKNLGQTAKLAALNVVKSIGVMLLVQAAITVVVDAIGRFQKAAEEQTRSKRAEIALERLSTVYRNVGDDADYATKAARDFDRQLAQAEYNRTIERLEEIRKKLNDIQHESKVGIQTWSELWRVLRQASENRIDPMGGDPDVGRLIAEEAKLRAYKRKYEAEENKKSAEQNIKIEAENRKNLEQQIKDIRIQQENELFQRRQQLAQKEVDIFRAAGELRIFQIEQANKKLIEGEEGASRAALESLNNYISVRERGELEIETAKKSLAIELANMEKEIENYKLENAKTIAKIKTESAQYEERVAKNIETIKRNGTKAQTADGAEIKDGFLVGSTGRSTGPHLDIRSPLGDSKAVIDEAYTIIKAWQAMGVAYIQLSNTGRDVKNVTNERELRSALVAEQRAHATRATGGAIDIAVPQGTLVPRRTGTPFWGGAGGWTTTSLDTGNTFMHGLSNSVASRGSAPTPVSTKAPDFSKLGTPAVEKFAAAVRSTASAMERLRVLQQALTQAQTKAAFEEIAKAAFPKVELEKYQDELVQVQLTYNALAQSSAGAFNPERSAIEVDRLTKQAIAARELKQILDAVAARTKLSAHERNQIEAQNKARHAETLKGLQQEEEARKRILAVQQATELIKNLQNQTKNVYQDLEILKLRERLEAEGVSPERIAAEENKLRIAQEIEELNKSLNIQLNEELRLRDELQKKIATANDKDKEELQKRLDTALAEIARLKEIIARLQKEGEKRAEAEDKRADTTSKDPVEDLFKRWKGEIKDTRGMIASMAQTIQGELSRAMSSAIGGVLSGTTTIGEAFSQMFKNIGDAFIQMATEMISKMIVMYIINTLLGGLGNIFGGGGGGGTNFSGAFGSGGPVFNPSVFGEGAFRPFAEGGYVTRPTNALIGEGGEPEYVIPQSKMNAAMQRYSSGSRGSAVLGGTSTDTSTGGSASDSTIDVRFNVERINSIDYVTVAEFQKGMQQAAQQGAKQGEQATLRRLQHSPNTRSRLGIR